MWLDAVAPSWPVAQQRIAKLVLVIIALANLVALDGHRDVMAHGPYFERVFAQSTLLKTSIDAGAPILHWTKTIANSLTRSSA